MICITCGKNEAINDFYEECEGCIIKFERCKGCWVKNKKECLKLFGSSDCARKLIDNGELKKDLIMTTLKNLEERLKTIEKMFLAYINEFRSNYKNLFRELKALEMRK